MTATPGPPTGRPPAAGRSATTPTGPAPGHPSAAPGPAGCRAVLSVAVDRPAAPGDRSAAATVRTRVAQVLADAGGTVGRLGSATVVALLPVADAGEAERVAEVARRSVAGLVGGGSGEAVTVSVGVAVEPDPARPGTAALWAADNALYAAARAGGDTVCVADRAAARRPGLPAPSGP